MRWQKELEFQKALRQARRAPFGQAIARLQQMSGAAVATLGKMMAEPSVPPRCRIVLARAERSLVSSRICRAESRRQSATSG